MAMEIQVTIALVNTEPTPPGNPGILVRAVRASTLIAGEDDDHVVDEFAIARHRLGVLLEEIQVDVDGQLQVYEDRAREGRGS